ncbi:MAG: PSD1 and planctomycete cytochrome C domain-containing protein [Acidobacteriota bacterium]
MGISLLLFLLCLPCLGYSGATSEGIEFFETKIRPVLVERCFSCHSSKLETPMSGLALDSRLGLLKGGSRGTAIVAGAPDQSLLIRALRYGDSALQMPPGEKLQPEQVADFEAWVKAGAPYGGDDAPALPRRSPAETHWAFEPPRDAPLPRVRLKKWPRNPIDFFILSRLEQKGLRPAAPADARTLLRRVTFDLTGLAPTPEEVEAFAADRSPDAFAKVVDRLLASPRYGERWGRFWLDVARYADTKGYVFVQEPRFPYSYTYRDWVIDAFNRDLPYDQFLIQQIAADRLPGLDKSSLAAMGFLTIGRRFLNNTQDVIDDRIDVVTRGTMALTVSCARCHDHKYDPIPTQDYYSLYGVFASSREPVDLPPIGAAADPVLGAEFAEELRKLEQDIAQYLEEKYQELLPALRIPGVIADYLMAALAGRGGSDEEIRALADKKGLNTYVLQRWIGALERARQKEDPVFAAWHAVAILSEEQFKVRGATAIAELAAQGKLHQLVAQALGETPVASLRQTAERYAALLARFDQAEAATDMSHEALRLALRAPDAPPNVPRSEVEKIFNRADRDKLTRLRKKVDQLAVFHPGAPPRAMALEDIPTPETARVFVRGNPKNPGPEVPRQFLALLSGHDRRPFQDGSGRLELARAIASPDNPLTARVAVNRVWLHHFGAGLVRTPSDFGTRSDPPSHPELLDYLARQFVAEGWSIKTLHRSILLSSTYQQSSQVSAEALRLDPENVLLSRMNRRRLDFEAMRDSLLFVSGQLDATTGGRAVDLFAQPYTGRRTIYGFIDRLNLPGLFRIFDFANPDLHSPQRHSTTVPQQALFQMNSPFFIEQAAHLVAKLPAAGDVTARIQRLYQLLYGRAATAKEAELGTRFLEAEQSLPPEPAAQPPAWQYGLGRYDAAGQRVEGFAALRHFTGEAWQDGRQLPDKRTGLAALRADGGHPGSADHSAVVRRWVAPSEGVVSVRGTLAHRQNEGDGIRAWIVLSGSGELAAWNLRKMEAETKIDGLEVKAGDSLDFVVDCRGNPEADSFRWAPIIRLVTPPAADGQPAPQAREWNAASDFRGPPGRPLSAWEKYAQVLLEANEFFFID